MLGMGWVLSMAVVEGLSAEETAARLEAELGEETIGCSMTFERPRPVWGRRRWASMATAGRWVDGPWPD
jgi:hypothetical protein